MARADQPRKEDMKVIVEGHVRENGGARRSCLDSTTALKISKSLPRQDNAIRHREPDRACHGNAAK